MFKFLFYSYFSDRKRKRSENFTCTLIYIGDFSEQLPGHLQNKGKPNSDKLQLELTAVFIFGTSNFLQCFISF